MVTFLQLMLGSMDADMFVNIFGEGEIAQKIHK